MASSFLRRWPTMAPPTGRDGEATCAGELPFRLEEIHSRLLPRADCVSLAKRSSDGDGSRSAANWCRRQVVECGKRTEQPVWRPWETATSRKVKKQEFGGSVALVLEALSCTCDVGAALASWRGRLGRKEQSMILNQQRQWQKAMVVFAWIKAEENYKPNIFFYNIMFKILGRAGEWDLVMKVWEEMVAEGVEPTNVTFSTLIDACGKVGKREEALHWYEIMQRKGLDLDEVTVNTLINLHKRAGDLEAAESLFNGSWRSGRKLPSPKSSEEKAAALPLTAPDSAAFNTMIGMYGRAGHYVRASRLFADMVQAGVAPDSITFNTMIYICGCSGRRQEAEALYRRMEDKGCVPDEATYNILIGIFAKEGDGRAALQYLEKMKAAGMEPDAVTCRSILSVTCDCGMVKETEAILEQTRQPKHLLGQAVMAKIVVMYVKAGLLDDAARAVRTFHSMESFSDKTFAVIINAYAEQPGSWQEAEKVFLMCTEKTVASDVGIYNSMIKVYGLAKRYTEALGLFNSLDKVGVAADDVTFNSVIQMCSAAGRVQELQQIFNSMVSRGFKPRQSTYGAALGLYGRLGLAKEAYLLFKQMQADGMPADEGCYGALLNAFCEAGSAHDAKITFEAMRKAGFSRNIVAYTSLMKLYGKLGLVEDARDLFSEVQQLGFGDDIYVCNLMMYILGKAGFLEESEKYYHRLQDLGLANEVTMTTMLNLYKGADFRDQALAIADQMQELGLVTDLEGFYSVMGLYGRVGRLEAAANVYLEMQEAICETGNAAHEMIDGILRKAGLARDAIIREEDPGEQAHVLSHQEALARFINVHALAGRLEEAVEACETLRQDSANLNVAAYNAMIHAYGSAGKFDIALQLFMEMQSSGLEPDVVSYTAIITIYGKMGLLEGVTRMHKRMKQNGCEPNTVTYSRLIEYYKEAGRLDLAAMVSHEMRFSDYLQQSQFQPRLKESVPADSPL